MDKSFLNNHLFDVTIVEEEKQSSENIHEPQTTNQTLLPKDSKETTPPE